MSDTHKAELKAGLNTVLAVSETIRELGEVPAGMLYAPLMGRVTMEGFDKIIAILKGAALIEVSKSHMVKWIGPLGGVR